MQRSRPAVVAFAVAVLVLGLAPAAAADPAVGPVATSWETVPLPGRSGDTESIVFEDLDVVAPTAVFAVGHTLHDVAGTFETRNLVERWDGTAWRVMATPDNEHAPTTNALYGVSGSSATDVWAVGADFGGSGPAGAFTLHYDGTRWSMDALPRPFPRHSAVALDVVSVNRGEAWAVGSASTLPSRAVLWHWTRGQWSSAALGQIPGCDGEATLDEVTATPSGEVYAAGSCAMRRGDTAFVLRVQSLSSWKVVAVLEPVALIEDIDVAADGTVYAAGRTGPEGRQQPLVLRIARNTATQLPDPPSAGPRPALHTIAVTGDGVTVGGLARGPDGSYQAYVATWRDGAWTTLPVAGSQGLSVTALDGSPGRAATWGVGGWGVNPGGSAVRPVRGGTG